VIEQQKCEFEKLLHSRAEFQSLEHTVAELTGLVISKNVKELSVQQKTTLKTIFGDTSILHTLKQSLAESEAENSTLKQLIRELVSSYQIMEKNLRAWWPQYAKILRLARDESAVD